MATKSCPTLFIGPFSPPYTGDGVKNSCLKDGFAEAGVEKITWFDTVCRKGNPHIYRLKLLPLLIKSKQVILSLNNRGRYAIISLFYLLKLFSNKRAVLYVVGGSFDQQVKDLPAWERWLYLRALKQLDGIFAESRQLKDGLLSLGLHKTELVYNPRVDSGARWEPRAATRGKVVFISRITEDKGVSILFEATKQLTREGVELSLDFYGPVEAGYESFFNENLKESGGRASYRGQIAPAQVQETLANYHFLVLPTFHYGEGLPGILVEAAMAGTPVITTNFNALPEYFQHEQSALLATPGDVNHLKQLMGQLLADGELARRLSAGILKVGIPFKSQSIINQSLQLLSSYGWEIKTKSDEH